MKTLCYSSFTFSYLDRARVLFETVRRHHPEWEIVALITDRPPLELGFDPAAEPFDRVVFSEDLGLADHDAWLFGHDVVEACTAVKGPFLDQACRSGRYDAAIYLDPDTALFNRLDPVLELLAEHEIVLTPHLLDPETTRKGVLDNEISALRTGIYNLGFVAIRTSGEGARFARWWAERLIEFCRDDIPMGLFTDQRWCDHVPALFDGVKVLRDPGYNVASWNISQRKVNIDRDGQITVNGVPLRFWHFTKLGPTGDAMTRRYAGGAHQVYEIWNWYKRRIEAVGNATPAGWWAYGTYADGTPIPKADRIRYRDDETLRARFPDPFLSGPGSYQEWLRQPEPSGEAAPEDVSVGG